MSNYKGYLTVLAGFTLMLYSGSVFILGNFAPFVQSYFAEATLRDTQVLLPLGNTVVAIGNFIGANLLKMKVISVRVQILVGSCIAILGVLFSTACVTGSFW